MDNPNNNQPRQRDIVYCHSCENEWYRDEHGLVCPECESDFTEIVETNNDPRAEAEDQPPPAPAPDPDEGDIDNLQWEETGPGRYRVRGRYTTDIPLSGVQQAQQQPGGLMGMVGNLLQGMIGGQGQEGQQGGQDAGPPGSAGGSPQQDGQPRGSTFVRTGGGPGYQYTIASSSNAGFGGSLFPRNANGPQPRQAQPVQIEQMLNAMMMNIGAAPGGQLGGGMRAGPGQHPFHDHDMHPGFGGPFMMGGPPGAAGFGPFGNLMQLLGGNGVAGDAVYTQEALDRIMTQLMEQHQAGNAPGPASETAIQSLPTREITVKDQGENGKAECSICMDEVELGGGVTVLPCSHWFHYDCVKAWLLEHDTCPHCRRGIMPKEGEGRRSSVPRDSTQAPLHDMHSPQYARPAGVPGAYPFPAQSAGGGSGTAQSPYTVPESPEGGRRSSAGERRASQGGSGGLYGRMRDAFGRGSSGGGGSGGGSAGAGEGRSG